MNKKMYVDVFPIHPKAIPAVSAYFLKTAGDASAIGGKLSYRLRRQLGGTWVWASGRLITDKPANSGQLQNFLRQIWSGDEEPLKEVQDLQPAEGWTPSPFDLADFVAHGMVSRYKTEVSSLLKAQIKDFGVIQVEREVFIRGWVVDGLPALSITLKSNIIHRDTLAVHLSRNGNLADIQGMWVADIGGDLKGEITKVVGPLQQNREWLLGKATKETTRRAIQNAPDKELTLEVQTRTSKYVYIASMLRPVVRMGDLEKFGVKPNLVVRSLRFEPRLRFEMINQVAAIYQRAGLIGSRLDSQVQPKNFLTGRELGFSPELKIGRDQIVPAGQGLMSQLVRVGLHRRSPLHPDKDHPILAGVIDATAVGTRKTRNEFLARLKKDLEQVGFSIKSVGVELIGETTRAVLERAIDRLEPLKPQIILALFPGFPHQPDEDESEDSLYHEFKQLTISRGIQSQVIYEDTFGEDYALGNILLGILGKTGNVPFVLAKPLPYADIVVGIDIARRRKKTLQGSVSATAIARIYFSDGKLLRYVIHDAPIDGETIPAGVLRKFFPHREFRGKRVVIQRDGYFRGEEEQALLQWADEIEAQFFLVEVIKTGAPRLYAQSGAITVDLPEKGMAFKLNDQEAFLVSSLPPFKGNTPCPLQIKTANGFPIEKGLHSVLALTLLHYGSIRQPRLPVTIHYSDKIAEFTLRGIKPRDLEGDIPFWL